MATIASLYPRRPPLSFFFLPFNYHVPLSLLRMPSPALSTCVATCVVIGVLSMLAQSCAAQPAITSISGCQTNPANPNYTINCDLPVNLTITGNNFTTATTFYFNTRITCNQLTLSLDTAGSPSLGAAYCLLGYMGPSWMPWQTPFNVTAVDRSVSPALTSAIFPGVTVLPVVPVVTAVSGCTDVGATTVDCLPAALTLTLTGANFTKLAWYSLLVIRISTTPNTLVQGPTVLNDTTMLLSFQPAYSYQVTEAMYGTLIPIYVVYGSDALNPVNITLAPLPRPQIYSVTGVNCLGTSSSAVNGVAVYNATGCYPSYSLVSISADYLYSVNVTVGGWPCLANAYNSDPTRSVVWSIVCLPVVEDSYVAHQPLDVTLTSPQYVVSLPGLLSFNSLPTITAISAADCPGDATGWNRYTSLQCNPGATITLSGLNLAVAVNGAVEAPRVQLWDRTGSAYINCLQPTLLNDTILTCVLPVPPDNTDAWEQYYSSLSTSVLFNYSAAGVVSNSFPAGFYAHLAGPALTNVTGCASSFGPLSVAGCQVGDVLTLVGNNFLFGGPLSIQATSSWQCANVSVSSWTTLTCAVAAPYRAIDPGQQLTAYIVVSVNGSLLASGAFYLTFGTAPLPAPSSSSPSSSSTRVVDIVVPIMVVLVVVVLAAGALYWWRRASSKRGSPRGDSQSESSTWFSFNHSRSDGDSGNTELGLYGRSM